MPQIIRVEVYVELANNTIVIQIDIMARLRSRSVVDIRIIAVKQCAVQPDFTWYSAGCVVAVPAVLIISADAVLVIEHEGKADFASHIVVRLLANSPQRLIVCTRRSGSNHIIRTVVAIISVPPSVVGEEFEASCAVFKIE